jgi:predicted amidohydrolase
MGICYDVRFVELARIMVENGAEILFYPGAFNQTTGPAHWELLFRSRALDNQVFCVGVAPALNMDASYHSYGHSIVTNPWGEVVCQADEKEDLIICEIDLDEIKKVRQELPVLKNKREDLYEVEFK